MNTTLKSILTLLTLTSIFLLVSCNQNQDQDQDKRTIIGSGLGVNNLTLLVNDLNSATNYYNESLGFSVGEIGNYGEYEGLATSSIRLSDMSTFEILSISDSVNKGDIQDFISSYLSKYEGIRFYSLSTSSIDSTSEWLKEKGYDVDAIKSFRSSEVSDGWTRDDGALNRSTLDFNQNNPVAHLPRFIEKKDLDYATSNQQWRTYYGYQRMYQQHDNGVVGIAAIRVAVTDLASSIDVFTDMGFESIEINNDIARFSIFKNQELHLVATNSNQEAADFVSERGEGVYAVQFEVENLDSTISFLNNNLNDGILSYDDKSASVPSEYAFGVELQFVQESEEQAQLASMLRFNEKLEPKAVQHAEDIYIKYCALCHGDNREGYAADNAPSLKSKSLLATSMNNNFMRYTIQFGRANTAMAGYLDTQGGPLEKIDIEILLKWLYEQAGVDEAIDPSREPVYGNIENGGLVYAKNCASCHGAKGEGITAPALGNPTLLATATDHFLRYAIEEGRDGTPMIAFKDSLSSDEIDDITAFLRSRASGWDVPEPSTVTVPSPDQYVLNPDGLDPEFELREGKFASSEQVYQAMKEKRKMIIMDARSEVAWRQMHIPGSLPVPYYEDPENFINDIPNDGTHIVIYCACPHAASLRVRSTLMRYGYKNISIIDEGILVWGQMGFPVLNGK